MKKRNLKSFKLSKESISNLRGGAGEANELPQDEQVAKSRRWWKCPKHCSAYCG